MVDKREKQLADPQQKDSEKPPLKQHGRHRRTESRHTPKPIGPKGRPFGRRFSTQVAVWVDRFHVILGIVATVWIVSHESVTGRSL
jgi:hypothetical protein